MLWCPRSEILSKRYFHFISFLNLFIAAAVFTGLMAVGSAWASTGYANEISNIAVQNVTPTSVDIVWDTVHLSNSQVILAPDQNYQAERRIAGAEPNLVNHHRVTVNHLLPYDASAGLGTYYFYVASIDINKMLSTYPGPYDAATGDPKTDLLSFQTAPPNPNGKSNYVLYTFGPANVYAGSDLYFQVQIAQLAGSHPDFYVHNQTGYNNGSDGVVKASVPASAHALNPQTISVHLECYESNANNSDANDQYYDAGKNMGKCWAFEYPIVTVRLRTAANTVRGNYAVTVTLQDNGQDVSTTYYFNVMPAPTAPLVVSSAYPPPIPGKDVWESNMTQLGHKYCDSTSYSGSRDKLNAAGNFLTGWGWEQDAWYYDGGRVYQQIASYTNDSTWNHCALTILDPYRQWTIANNGTLPWHSIFAYGMAMNYWRTGDIANLNAIKTLATLPVGAQIGGWVDPTYMRETAYGADVRITYELLTGNRDRLLAKNIDKLLGHLDMVYNGQIGSSHPFIVGLALETAIHYYDMTVAEGHPDYRVPPVVKRALDALYRDYYVPGTHTFRYTRFDMPTIDNWNDLNDLVAPAYAWYWNLTGDPVSLNRGDDLFQHTFDIYDEYSWCGKEFSQIYKWSFDYVRWRSGMTTSTTVKDSNPFDGPYPDTEPPIETQVAVGNVTNNTATITWKTYENADSQIIYGVGGGYYPLQSAVQDSGQGTMSHSVTLVGLTAGTTYHYRIDSRDAAKNLASLADATFTTAGGSGGGGTITGGGSGNTGGGTIAGSGSGGSGTTSGDGNSSASGSGSTTAGTTTSGDGTASAHAASGYSASSSSKAYTGKSALMQ